MSKKNRKIIRYSLIIIVLVCAMVLICDIAFARAGGGGGYGGGSRGGGKGGGGLGNLAGALLRPIVEFLFDAIIDILTYLCTNYPLIGYPLVALLLAGVLWFIWFLIKSEQKERDKYVEDFYRDSGYDGVDSIVSETFGPRSSVSLDNAALDSIKMNDPDFNEKEFRVRAKKAFSLIQSAWSNRDLSKVEAFLADGTYEQFLIQLGIMKENHIKDYMENLNIIDTYVLGYESDNNIDSIFLQITASAKNYFIDDRTNKFIKGDKQENTFTEIWTFIRRTGAKTLGKPGLIEGYCPNCGNKISIGRHTNCSSCGCLLRSGEHDWIVSNITQQCEWFRKNNNLIPGVRKYIAFDPGFNVQHIEDLVSMMYWRKVSSDRLKDIATFRKIATDKFCNKIKKQYESVNGYSFYDDCAVGSIKLLAIDTEKNDKEDYIYVEIAWSGIEKNSKDSKNTNIINSFKKLFEKKKIIRSIYVLKRKRGVMTDVRTGLCAAPCPNCGAMESNSSSNECEYCGAVMNDGNRDWVVDDILNGDDNSIDRAISKVKLALNRPIKFNGYENTYKKNKTNSNITSSGNLNSETNIKPEFDSDIKPNTYSNNEKLSIKRDFDESTVIPTMNGNLAATAMGVSAGLMANNFAERQKAKSQQNNIYAINQLKWLIAMMLVDNNVNRKEFDVICKYALQLGVTENIVGDLVKEIMAQSNPIDYIINSAPLDKNYQLMQMIIRVAFADGKIAKEELGLLKYIAKRMDLSEEKFKELLDLEKKYFNNN